MAVQGIRTPLNRRWSLTSTIPYVDLAFDVNNYETSVLNLIYWIRPKWRAHADELKITKFTEGITNTLLMVARHRPGASQKEIESDAILMRAYGNGTDLIIDRDREATSHRLLADRGMAPPLYARFQNGLLYGFIPGKVCKAQDLTQPPVWRGVARKLGEWHAKVPISGISDHGAQQNGTNNMNGHSNGFSNGQSNGHAPRKQLAMSSRQPTPNVWSVMQNWVNALSTDTEKERARKEMLQKEMELSYQELDTQDGIGEHGFVFGHCDLLCANVIVLQDSETPSQSPSSEPQSPSTDSGPEVLPVTFIDYEYATPAPAVFDISNHFAEWAGYDCEYGNVPTKSARRGFIEEYVSSYSRTANKKIDSDVTEAIYAEVDRWRGIPGLYWGIWSLIQAKISDIDFDYSAYAELRLSEYFAWRGEVSGSRAREGRKMPLREKRWAED